MTCFVTYIAVLDTVYGPVTTSDSSSQRAVAVCIDTRDGAGRNRLHGVAQFARRLDWRTMLVRQGGRSAAHDVARLRPHGIIAYVADQWLIDAAERLGVPLVDTALGEPAAPFCVSVDNAAIGRLAAAHLTAAGLKYFGYCGVRDRIASVQRRDCFADCLAPHAVASFAEPVTEGESRLQQLVRWLKRVPKPIGLLAFDDKFGERVLNACRWAGLAVPHEVAVLGIGDDQLMCEVSWPSLSSISLPTARLGFEAAKLLDAAMAGRPIARPHRKFQPTGVIMRSSTDMVAVEDALVKSTVHFIRARAGDLIGIEQVAQALGVGRRTLDRHFMAALGRTASDELTRVRMQKAATLLADESQPIAGIARACGYAAASSFSRAFHEHVGLWPSEHRKATRAG